MKRQTPRTTKGVPRPLDARAVAVHAEKRGGTAKYHDGVPDLVLRMTRLGMTAAQVAANLGVDERTLTLWLSNRREVRQAFEEGRWESMLHIEESLYKKARGYEYEEVKTYHEVDMQGREFHKTVKTIRRIEPDTTALIFYMKNRYPERWRDVWNPGQGGGSSYTQVNINNTLKLDSLSEKEREMVASVAMQQIEDMDGYVQE